MKFYHFSMKSFHHTKNQATLLFEPDLTGPLLQRRTLNYFFIFFSPLLTLNLCHRPSFFIDRVCLIDQVLCYRPSIGSSTEFCVIDRVLCHRPSFVSSTEFCVIDRVLCHRPSFVLSIEFCVIDQVLCHRPSFVWSSEFCVIIDRVFFAIDRVLFDQPS